MFEILTILGVAAAGWAFLTSRRNSAQKLPANLVNLPTNLTPGGIGSGRVESALAGQGIGAIEKTVLGGLGAGAAGAGAGVAGAGAAVGTTLSTGLETAGVGAAVTLIALGIGNIAQCGTITTIGCTKRGDTDLGEEAYAHARIIYQYFLQGQVSADVALQGMAQIAKECKQYMQRPSDYTNDGNGPCHSCGNFTTYNSTVAAQLGHPPDLPINSPAYHVFCNYTKDTNLQFVLETGFPNLIRGGVNAWQKYPQYFNGGSLQAAIGLNAGVTNN